MLQGAWLVPWWFPCLLLPTHLHPGIPSTQKQQPAQLIDLTLQLSAPASPPHQVPQMCFTACLPLPWASTRDFHWTQSASLNWTVIAKKSIVLIILPLCISLNLIPSKQVDLQTTFMQQKQNFKMSESYTWKSTRIDCIFSCTFLLQPQAIQEIYHAIEHSSAEYLLTNW